MSTTPHVSPGSLSLTSPSPSFSEQSAFNINTAAPHLPHHLPHQRPHQLTTSAYSPPAAPANPAAAAPTAAPSNPPELELSPISKGFIGKGPRSRPNSARPYTLSAASELPQGSDSQPEGGSGGHAQPSSGPAHSNAGLSHPSSGNGNSNAGHAFASTSGDCGHGEITELSTRLSGGGRSSGGDGQGLVRRRSRSLSLSREQGEALEASQQRQQGGGHVTPEPEVQQASTAAEGDSPLSACFALSCMLFCSHGNRYGLLSQLHSRCSASSRTIIATPLAVLAA